jgi:hypothetical protein
MDFQSQNGTSFNDIFETGRAQINRKLLDGQPAEIVGATDATGQRTARLGCLNA